MREMTVFVTVGSTSFDELIQSVCSENCINLLASNGFKEITFQIGKGNVIPQESSAIKVSWFRFKESITDDIKSASLIIGHAGAGTILESLYKNKPLIVVLNEDLMDNHQGELAEKLAEEDLLKYTTCSSLTVTLGKYISNDFARSEYDPKVDRFTRVLHHILGLK